MKFNNSNNNNNNVATKFANGNGPSKSKSLIFIAVTVSLLIATFTYYFYSYPATEVESIPPIKQDLYSPRDGNNKNNNRQKILLEKDAKKKKRSHQSSVEILKGNETHPLLRQLNKHYHAQRARIRAMNPAPFRVHTFFTMDCTDHSFWQAGTLENSWEKVGQEGFLSRIISGCETAPPQKVQRSQRHFLSSDEFADRRRGSFYAPYASTLPSGRHYAPYNRPHSVYYWLKHADLESEEVFVMLDPDMVFLNALPTESVRVGKPVSQIYDYMLNSAFETYRCPSCPRHNWDRRPYAVGPPWMMHIDDWVRVTPRWIQITSELAEMYPSNWIVEMIAYSIACKVEHLPHIGTYRAMVDKEDDLIVWESGSDRLGIRNGDSGKYDLPSTLHYCYTMEVGERAPTEATKGNQHTRMANRDGKASAKTPILDYYHFSKYRVPSDWPGGKGRYERNFMSCDCPLLQEFHSFGTLAQKIFRTTDGENVGDATLVIDGVRQYLSSNDFHSWRRQNVMLNYLLPAVNDAMTVYKNRYCVGGDKNLSKQLRTSHPAHFISSWILDSWDEKGIEINFHRNGQEKEEKEEEREEH